MVTEDLIIEAVKKRTCFIITPIGNDTDPIRRHIDGLIDECITPVLKEKYNISVAHRISAPGSITNQVLTEIYKADLVIANLTNLNPNVMYELAFRHAVKKPVIIIMQKDSGLLPFDTITERTIFYTNDFKGAIELKENIKQTVEAIENTTEIDNPIYTALEKIKVTENVIKDIALKDGENTNAMNYIINSLQKLEDKVSMVSKLNVTNNLNNMCEDIYIHDVKENAKTLAHLVDTIINNYKNENKEMFLHKVTLGNDVLKVELRSNYMLDIDDIMTYISKKVPTNPIDQIPFN